MKTLKITTQRYVDTRLMKICVKRGIYSRNSDNFSFILLASVALGFFPKPRSQ